MRKHFLHRHSLPAAFAVSLIVGASLAQLLSNSATAAPMAVADTGATDENTPLAVVDPGATISLFANDLGSPLSLVSADSTSTQGAAVNVNVDGTFSYNPAGSATLQALPWGGLVNDTFSYTVTDSASVALGRFIRVQNNGTATRRMDIGEIEVFAPGVVPAVNNAGGTGFLNPTTDLATTGNGASLHSKGATMTVGSSTAERPPAAAPGRATGWGTSSSST